MYLDACNLYGYAMKQSLPTSNFKWMNVSSIDDWTEFILKQEDEFILKQEDEHDDGYILQVDLEYPEEELHDMHKNLPLSSLKLLYIILYAQ